MEFCRLCDKVVYEVQDRIRLLPLEPNNVFCEGLVDEDGLFAGSGVNADDRVNRLDRGPAKDTANLAAVLTLFDAGVEGSEGFQVGAERRRQAVIRSDHADVLGVSPAPCRNREACQECGGWRLALKRLVVMPQCC